MQAETDESSYSYGCTLSITENEGWTRNNNKKTERKCEWLYAIFGQHLRLRSRPADLMFTETVAKWSLGDAEPIPRYCYRISTTLNQGSYWSKEVFTGLYQIRISSPVVAFHGTSFQACAEIVLGAAYVCVSYRFSAVYVSVGHR